MHRSRATLFLALSLTLVACDAAPAVTPADAGRGDAARDGGMTVDCTGRPAAGPSPRGEVAGVFDGARGRFVVYGGNTAAPVMCMPMYEHTAEVWAFHVDCSSWSPIATTGGPGVRTRVATAHDSTRDRMIVFGGRDREGFGMYVNYADVWALDLATDTWSEIATTGTGPSPRSSAIAAYDAARDRLLVFGGNTSTSGLTLTGAGDFFALDLATGAWSTIDAAGAPSPRLYHASAIVGGELVVFGGTPNFDGPFLNDTYAFDLAAGTWRVVHDGFADPAPDLRFGAQLVAHESGRRVLMIAGHDGGELGNRNDVWALDLAGGAWSRVHEGDVWQTPALGRCEFPPDFATLDESSPERRYAFAVGQSASTGYVFGGKTDCGNVSDVWALDVATGAWTSMRPSTGGESCQRSGRAGCTTLCY